MIGGCWMAFLIEIMTLSSSSPSKCLLGLNMYTGASKTGGFQHDMNLKRVGKLRRRRIVL